VPAPVVQEFLGGNIFSIGNDVKVGIALVRLHYFERIEIKISNQKANESGNSN
jgi:hypothetical protein